MAVVCARDGEVAVGGREAFAECDGRGLLVDVTAGLAPAALARALAPHLGAARGVVCPASADGRDLAPRLAAELGRPLLPGAVLVEDARVVLARHGGRVLEDVTVDGPFVTTLLPGVRGVPGDLVMPDPVDLDGSSTDGSAATTGGVARDPRVVGVTEASAAELDLAEAERVLGVGAGVGDERFVALAALVADALDLSLGATRVVTDHGWLPVDRQIGTTGVEIDPRVYVALGISGAIQHVAGLGDPDHVVSVNLDGSCPMSAMADLDLVTDARAVLIALADRLGIEVDPELRRLVASGSGPSVAGGADVVSSGPGGAP